MKRHQQDDLWMKIGFVWIGASFLSIPTLNHILSPKSRPPEIVAQERFTHPNGLQDYLYVQEVGPSHYVVGAQRGRLHANIDEFENVRASGFDFLPNQDGSVTLRAISNGGEYHLATYFERSAV